MVAASGTRGLPADAGGFHELRMVARAENVLLHPREERAAVAGDGIPRLAEGVVAAVVAVRVARMRPEGDLADRLEHPMRQVAGVLRRLQVVDDLFHRDDRGLRGEHRFLLDAD